MAKKKADPIAQLKEWAVARGAEAQVLTNPYELLRLRVNGGVAIVYRKDNGQMTWNDLAKRLRVAMETGAPFPEKLRLVEKVERDFVPGKQSVMHRTLIERDGEGCFYCGDEKPGEMTVEHLVARAHGGPNHISNKFRADRKCNEEAGHLSAPEKIRIRETNLLARAAQKAAA